MGYLKIFFKIYFFIFRNDIIFVLKYETMAKKVSYNEVQIALLAEVFNKSTQTIRRWIIQNDDRLTSDKAKKAFLDYSNFKSVQS